jgi:hypothetical protein
MALYTLERPSSWGTLRIRLSWPRSRGRLSLLLVLFPQVYSCLLWPTQYLAVLFNGSYFALNPFLAYWRLNTSGQTYLHHTSSTPSSRLTAPDPSRRVHGHMDIIEKDNKVVVVNYIIFLNGFYTLFPFRRFVTLEVLSIYVVVSLDHLYVDVLSH